MKPEDCPKLDDCYKVKMILDKDLLDFQYAEAMRAVCANCPGVPEGSQRALPDFREYTHQKYPELDEDLITTIEDLIERRRAKSE